MSQQEGPHCRLGQEVLFNSQGTGPSRGSMNKQKFLLAGYGTSAAAKAKALAVSRVAEEDLRTPFLRTFLKQIFRRGAGRSCRQVFPTCQAAKTAESPQGLRSCKVTRTKYRASVSRLRAQLTRVQSSNWEVSPAFGNQPYAQLVLVLRIFARLCAGQGPKI